MVDIKEGESGIADWTDDVVMVVTVKDVESVVKCDHREREV